MQMQWTSWATIAALAVYFWTFMNAGKARMQHKVLAPSMDGPPEFLRALRVQTNTLEQIIFFLPFLWLAAIWFSDRAAGIAGAVWVVGRFMYALAYYQDAAKRAPGFMIATLASLALLLMAMFGLLQPLFSTH